MRFDGWTLGAVFIVVWGEWDLGVAWAFTWAGFLGVLDCCLCVRLHIDIRNDVSFGYYFELLFGDFGWVSLWC